MLTDTSNVWTPLQGLQAEVTVPRIFILLGMTTYFSLLAGRINTFTPTVSSATTWMVTATCRLINMDTSDSYVQSTTMTLQELWSRRAAKPVADTFVSLRDTLGLRPHHARVAHGICGNISTCSRADQYTGMTVERYNRKPTRLSVGNGTRQYGTDGRG